MSVPLGNTLLCFCLNLKCVRIKMSFPTYKLVSSVRLKMVQPTTEQRDFTVLRVALIKLISKSYSYVERYQKLLNKFHHA
jgi:hypothetical protein